MTWIISHDVAEFLAAAGALLNSRPAEHTVLLTVAETLHRTGSAAFGQSAPPRFGWWRSEDETVRSAFLHTPPHPVLLTATSQPAAASLAAMLADGPAVSGVNADPASAQAFAAAWSSRAGVTPRLRRRQRLYRVGQLVPGRPYPSRRRDGPCRSRLYPRHPAPARLRRRGDRRGQPGGARRRSRRDRTVYRPGQPDQQRP